MILLSVDAPSNSHSKYKINPANIFRVALQSQVQKFDMNGFSIYFPPRK